MMTTPNIREVLTEKNMQKQIETSNVFNGINMNSIITFLTITFFQLRLVLYSIIMYIYERCTKFNINSSTQVMSLIIYFPLIFEIYCMLFHTFIVRLWIFINFFCTGLHMYDNLSNPDIKTRLIPIGKSHVKKFSAGVISTGCALLLLSTGTVGFTTIPLIIYLINRTAKNVFGKGF
jgi:hypothetical protein